MAGHRIYQTSFASVYPHYVEGAEEGAHQGGSGRDHPLADGLFTRDLDAALDSGTDFENFFASAPKLNPARALITGVVCGVRVETVAEPLMQEIRYLDKLIDELAKGKAMAKILRS